jgi:hypothetical protein
VWLPLQLCCGDDVHLSSFLKYVSTVGSDRQQQQSCSCALWLCSPPEQHMLTNNISSQHNGHLQRLYSYQVSSRHSNWCFPTYLRPPFGCYRGARDHSAQLGSRRFASSRLASHCKLSSHALLPCHTLCCAREGTLLQDIYHDGPYCCFSRTFPLLAAI